MMKVILYTPDILRVLNNTPTIVTVNSKDEFNKVCMDFFAEYITDISELTVLSGKDKDGFYEKVFLEEEEEEVV